MVFTTIPFQTAMRAAAVQMLTDYAFAANIKLQVYPGRPRTLYPPTAFVDRLLETLITTGPTMRQRSPRVIVTVVHGLFDSKDAVEQRDAFMDGFLDWVLFDYHAAGATTLIDAIATEDIPNFVPDWVPPEQQLSYYATEITLGGYAGG